MVIQRWQSLLLFLAVIAMAAFCLTPFAYTVSPAAAELPVMPACYPVFLILNVLIAVLLLMDIFMYKNLRKQMGVAMISAFLLVASMITCGIIVWVNQPDYSAAWLGGFPLLVVALVLTLWARSLMGRDRKLLSSYDRLR